MRILAIRGKNLASLADEFEILLNKGVLQNAGLFAITGQTGAGKSTILDALCLALYDEIPRLPSGEGFTVGHKGEDENLQVKHNDVRSILRRGASSGFAEVDFIAKDKQHYRARWQVSKARNKVNGKIQKQEMLLSNIKTGQQLGQNKTDTLKQISDLVGLSFEQFRRSVLLAQGDFAAFLKAKKDERSSLLERITGTELYSTLSIAAHERARQEETELKRIKALLNNQIPLLSETRLQLEQQRDQAIEQLKILDEQINANQKIIDWYVQLKKHQQAEQAASLALADCSQARQNAEPISLKLKQIAAVEPLRPLLSHYQQSQADSEEAAVQLKNSHERHTQTENQLQIAINHTAVQNQNLDTVEKQLQNAQPALKAIRALDTRLETVQATLQGLQQEQQAALVTLSNAQTEQQGLIKQRTTLENNLHALTEQLNGQQNLATLAADWTYWSSELNRYQQLFSQRETSLATAVAMQKNLDKQKHGLNTLEKELTAKQQILQEQHQQLKHIKQQDSGQSLAAIAQAREILDTQQQQLNQANTLATQALELQQRLQQDTQRLSASEQNIKQAEQAINQLSQQQQINTHSLAEAKKALALIEASRHKNAIEFRALLIAQQPCPVCGSLEHPCTPVSSELSLAQKNRVDELEQEKTELIKQLSQTQKNLEQQLSQVTELTENIATATAKMLTLSSAWNTLIFNDKPLLNLQDITLLPLLKQQQQSLATELLHIKQQEKIALDLQQQLSKVQKLLDSTKQALDLLSNDHVALDKQYTAQQSELRAQRATIETQEKQLNEIVEHASRTIPDCEQLLDWQNPAALAKKVKQYQQAQQEQTELSNSLVTLTQKIELITQSCQQHEQQLTVKQNALNLETQQQQHLLLERSELIVAWGEFANPNNATADVIEQHFIEQLKVAKTAQQHALNTLNQLNTELTTLKTQQQHWQQESERRTERQQAAFNTLHNALENLAINQEQLNELLQINQQWLSEQQAFIEQLDKALQSASSLLQIKTEDRKQHEQQAVMHTEEAAQQIASELQTQKQQVSDQKQECDFQLREDDKIRITYAQHSQQLEAQQQRYQQWQSLNELIGSASGSKFRIFAQSLTLEALLAHSNQHLADFAKRYVLQRVPSSDLELQIIDKDMADDVRSVHSLSGGESFLVSLALALGLASLSSNRTQVESLFIDEGFGSLDPETLDIAISSLDTLQSLGRKVGVISHVPILVERIGTKVVVEKCGGGRSKVMVVGGY